MTVLRALPEPAGVERVDVHLVVFGTRALSRAGVVAGGHDGCGGCRHGMLHSIGITGVGGSRARTNKKETPLSPPRL